MKSWVKLYQAEGRLWPNPAAGLKPYKLNRKALTKVMLHLEIARRELIIAPLLPAVIKTLDAKCRI